MAAVWWYVQRVTGGLLAILLIAHFWVEHFVSENLRRGDLTYDAIRARIYQRLWDVLSAKDQSGKFARLSADDRRSILEILRDTKPGLPAYWR